MPGPGSDERRICLTSLENVSAELPESVALKPQTRRAALLTMRHLPSCRYQQDRLNEFIDGRCPAKRCDTLLTERCIHPIHVSALMIALG
jgi:hypothetical protein